MSDAGASDATALLARRFRLGDLLGTGGSASVFAAVDTHSDRPIALKILHPHLSNRPAAREAFLAEARKVEPLRHPNVVGVLDVGSEDASEGSLAWIALERAEGVSLSEFVAQHGPLDAADAAAMIVGVLDALTAAHEIGLVHRDVSPANVMVKPTPDGRIETRGVRLLDFGLADAAGRSTLGQDDLLSVDPTGRSGVLGNVNYLSPEQARGGAVDARGDVYQTGAVLYFALTGRAPFPRDRAEETMRAHLYTPPPVPSVLSARVPRSLDRIVVRAMLKDPADRFASAAAMRAAVTGSRVDALAPHPSATTFSTGSVASVAGLGMPESPAGAPRSAEPDVGGSTRVLGRTTLPPRVEVDSGLETESSSPARRSTANARSRRGGWYALAACAVVAVAVVLAVAAADRPTASIELPSPTGTPQAQPSNTPTPEPGEPVAQGVSLLPVPDLTRMTIGEAQTALRSAGFVVGAIASADSALPRDAVVATDPAAGSSARPGSPVSLTVASGYNAVPEVAGQGRDAAAARLQEAGFAPSFAYRAAASGTPAGTILGTDPASGSTIAVGTPVSVFEAVPSAPTPPPAPTPTATPPPPVPTMTPSISPEPGP